ncbi:MAG: acyltransferase [Blastocatellia bacterium]|nr:acyltransferase [Blastocatellia bacterium]MCS7157457.1 acyltransferase [Blastocatellia bacterium]MCX7752630.1 acyltransferase [Blastocatellia bacterium]MDW8168361.1 acyltransferase [Acidobacteriota bacterium]MDW8255557.1 acyltransferase [Acidobacteriota bacterium]
MTWRDLLRLWRRMQSDLKRAYYEEKLRDELQARAPGLQLGRHVTIIRPDRLILGENVIIHDHCVLYCAGHAPEYRQGGRIVIGNHVELAWGCILHGGGAQIILRDFAIVGAGAVLVSEMYSYRDLSRPARFQPKRMGDIVVEENATIGANAVVLPGVTIGRSAIVGAGAVVTRDIPPFSIAVGVPARVIKRIDAVEAARDS